MEGGSGGAARKVQAQPDKSDSMMTDRMAVRRAVRQHRGLCRQPNAKQDSDWQVMFLVADAMQLRHLASCRIATTGNKRRTAENALGMLHLCK